MQATQKQVQYSSHFGFPIGMILATFDLQVTLILPISSFESTGLSVQKFKIDFQDDHCSCHTGFLIRTNTAIFDLQVTLILPTKFQVNWPFGSDKKPKIVFQDRGLVGHLGFSNRSILAVLIYMSSLCFLPSFRSVGPPAQEKCKIDFHDSPHGWPSWISNQNDFCCCL